MVSVGWKRYKMFWNSYIEGVKASLIRNAYIEGDKAGMSLEVQLKGDMGVPVLDIPIGKGFCEVIRWLSVIVLDCESWLKFCIWLSV